MEELTTHPVQGLSGEYCPPGDKSISHRLVMLGAIAEGRSSFANFLSGDDCLRTIQTFQAMGVEFNHQTDRLEVVGVGLDGLKKPNRELDLGNSGTTMRLLLGLLAGQRFESHLTGDSSLKKRPMRRVTDPLKRMGANITGMDNGNFAPMTIRGRELSGIIHQNVIPSAQVKSAVLLAGLYAKGETVVEEVVQSRDHTERLFSLFGVPFEQQGYRSIVRKADRLTAIQYQVPGDISSAAFLIVAGLLVPNSDLLVQDVGLNPTRIGLLDVLQQMGGNIEIKVTQAKGEPVGEVRVQTSELKGVRITNRFIPILIDELPILMIACALAKGTSMIEGAEELRIKETDRIRSMVSGINAIGGKALEQADGCVIEGVRQFKGGSVSSFGDHRTAMSFLVSGLCSERGVTVQNTACIQTSYPAFLKDLGSVSTSR